MIIEFYPNPANVKPRYTYPWKKDEPLPVVITQSNDIGYTPSDLKESIARNISMAEYQRRDAIVKAAFKACAYAAGDLVYPHNKEWYDKLGQCRVLGINHRYSDMKEAEWKSDYPKIILAQPLRTGQERFIATHGFFRKTPPTE